MSYTKTNANKQESENIKSKRKNFQEKVAYNRNTFTKYLHLIKNIKVNMPSLKQGLRDMVQDFKEGK